MAISPHRLRSISGAQDGKPVPAPTTVSTFSQPVKDKFAEQQAASAATRNEQTRLASLKTELRAAPAADAESAATAQREGGTAPKPTVAKIEKAVADSEAKLGTLKAVLAQIDSELVAALAADAPYATKQANDNLRSELIIANTEIDNAVRALARVQAALDHRAWVSAACSGQHPRGNGARPVTMLLRPNGNPVTVADALAAASFAIASMTGEA